MEVNRDKMVELALLVGEILREADALAKEAGKPAEDDGMVRLPRRVP